MCAARAATIAVIQRSHARSLSFSLSFSSLIVALTTNAFLSALHTRAHKHKQEKLNGSIQIFRGRDQCNRKNWILAKATTTQFTGIFFKNFVYTYYIVWYAITSYKIASLIFIRIFLCRRVCILVLLFLHTSAQCAPAIEHGQWTCTLQTLCSHYIFANSKNRRMSLLICHTFVPASSAIYCNKLFQFSSVFFLLRRFFFGSFYFVGFCCGFCILWKSQFNSESDEKSIVAISTGSLEILVIDQA